MFNISVFIFKMEIFIVLLNLMSKILVPVDRWEPSSSIKYCSKEATLLLQAQVVMNTPLITIKDTNSLIDALNYECPSF